MRFGLFYEHQLPRPWEPDSEEKLLTDALEQVELADGLGFDSVWEVEHHFLEEYSHSSAPEVFLGAVSQRTKQIRLGHGIVQLPPGFNHPARVAERIATLDLVSGGRVEFGTGESSSQMELGGYGVDRATKREQWQEALDAVTRMLVEEPFAGYDGQHFSMPPRNVLPKPKQKPHPPLWVACSRRDTILVAAENGIGALSFSFIEPDQAKEWVDDYYAIIASEKCVPAGFDVNPNVAVVVPMMCHPDEATAIERGIDGGHFFGYSLAHYYVFGEHVSGLTNVWDEFQERRAEFGFAREIIAPDEGPLGVKLLQQGLGSLRGAVGTPEQVAELCERYDRAGVDEVIFVLQAGRNRHEHICESIERFGKEVLPRFAEGKEAKEAEKRERLAEPIAKALARRSPARPAPPDYLVSPQGEPAPAVGGPIRRQTQPASSPAPAPVPSNGGRRNGRAVLARRIGKLGEAAFGSFVHGRTDEQLERTIGSRPGMTMIFKGMERAFIPSKVRKFRGDIQYEVEGRNRTHRWIVRIGDGRATAKPGRSESPAVTVRTTVPIFARLAANDLPPIQAFMEGKISIDGDFEVAAQMGEWFGQEAPW